MARQYYKEHVTAFSYDGDTGMMDDVGSGTLEISTADVENSALKDAWTDSNLTKSTATFEGELVADSSSTNWFAKQGGSGTLLFTDGNGSITGTFVCTKVSKSLNDAMRWNVSLKSKGTVTVS